MTGTDRTSTIAAVRRGDLTAQEVAESHKPSAKIEDFGEKIGGAKKDLRQTYQKAMSEVLPVDAKNITLSPKTGPSPFRMQNTVPLIPCHQRHLCIRADRLAGHFEYSDSPSLRR